MKKFIVIILVIVLVLTTTLTILLTTSSEKTDLVSIKSEKELERIYEGETDSLLRDVLELPFSFFKYQTVMGSTTNSSSSSLGGLTSQNFVGSAATSESSTSSSILDSISSSKDYSTTNIQVENVDEADIIKTDGDYIYSISEDEIVITDVTNPTEIKIASTIQTGNGIPEDLILQGNKLVAILTNSTTSSFSYYSKTNTIVRIYNIENREQPKLEKFYELYEPYYTSRCIDGKLYVISSGKLREENEKIVREYREDGLEKEINLKNIKRFNDIETNSQTLISMIDLNNISSNVNVNSYLMDISNAYVSENSIYLLNEEYSSNSEEVPISSLFGLKGVYGFFESIEEKWATGYESHTAIYKFNILDNGEIEYSCKNEVKGRTINQYSVDEYNGTLRVALYDNDGSRVVILDNNLKEIGKTYDLAKGETMYSSRFMGDKAYLVTYRTVDPLYVIDLSNPSSPKVLGELKIPGYSTYLHPYDENHIIGIGMETKETIRRNSSGKVISTTASIVGMKMALFDVTDVTNPIQMSSVVIGDSRTTSAILTNPKALLFSKERELIAIPVNNYAEDFEVSNSAETYSSAVIAYKNKMDYISEGYLVYNINLENGIELKGSVVHENDITTTPYYRSTSKLLRGLYIDDNLYTVSENKVKVNNLETLELVNELNIKEEK